jgi:hypothetical protein
MMNFVAGFPILGVNSTDVAEDCLGRFVSRHQRSGSRHRRSGGSAGHLRLLGCSAGTADHDMGDDDRRNGEPEGDVHIADPGPNGLGSDIVKSESGRDEQTVQGDACDSGRPVCLGAPGALNVFAATPQPRYSRRRLAQAWSMLGGAKPICESARQRRNVGISAWKRRAPLS